MRKTFSQNREKLYLSFKKNVTFCFSSFDFNFKCIVNTSQSNLNKVTKEHLVRCDNIILQLNKSNNFNFLC